ncbi:MAG TPA: glutamate-5-semialdehyde dehydrogenase [Candidatus Marinimicrobia bacterium]|nr:glutamate-5-semialdehyde dehydrogenase [Candidatus Neomarinimicrobiota bacterium]
MSIRDIAVLARKASLKLAGISGEVKNKALRAINEALIDNQNAIITANKKDLKKAKEQNIGKPLLKRLKFDGLKIRTVCDGIDSLIELPDPLGKTLHALELDSGLELYKVSCPIGVIGVIFESRPDALVQISTLCLKSGNAVLLKGGREALETNRVLAQIISESSEQAGLPKGWLGLLETRSDVAEILDLDNYIDLIIPRGSNRFVKYIMNNTTIPVLGHSSGICHVYVDSAADLEIAVKIAVDSKCQYVAACNAMETLLVHKDVANEFLPKLIKSLKQWDVEVRGCKRTQTIIDCSPATEADWKTEYLDYILSIGIVDSVDEAIAHINRYGSGHTDSIVTNNKSTAEKFMNLVDSADVFLNCSTRFSDGYRYGLGAEVGISTNKIHARGPVGMEGLLSYKWKMLGSGQIVSDYSGSNGKKFTHKTLNRNFYLK